MLSISRLRRELNTGAGDDDLLRQLRDQVVQLWEDRTGLLWSSRTGYVETLSPTHDRATMVWLGLRPVTAVTKVEERQEDSAIWTEIAASAWFSDAAYGRLTRIRGVWAPHVRVTYDGGYTEGGCPAAIAGALIIQAKFMVARFGEGKLILRSQALEGGMSSFYEQADLHPFFAAAVAQHRRKV